MSMMALMSQIKLYLNLEFVPQGFLLSHKMNGSDKMSLPLVSSDSFSELLLNDTPFLDVRSEGEFAKGTIPGAVNFPILNDQERHLVGTCYKQQGKEQAVELGHSLVKDRVRQDRVDAWCQLARENPGLHLYCWRGGMRSNLTQQWMHDEGVEVPLIDGGFKAIRRFLIATIDDAAESANFLRIAGRTGTAKTPLVNEIKNSIDLEAHANHRGSSFGRRVNPPPSQVNFENTLAVDLLKTRTACPEQPIILEDEGSRIGSASIPDNMYRAMKESPAVMIDMPLEFRIQRILDEYVIEMLEEFEAEYREDGFAQFSAYLTDSLSRVQKRLGLERYRKINQIMESSLHQQAVSGETDGHREWISRLLLEYYDPMYEYQMDKEQKQFLFQGSYADVREWVRLYHH